MDAHAAGRRYQAPFLGSGGKLPAEATGKWVLGSSPVLIYAAQNLHATHSSFSQAAAGATSTTNRLVHHETDVVLGEPQLPEMKCELFRCEMFRLRGQGLFRFP